MTAQREEIRNLKTQAKNRRDLGRFEQAAARAKAAIQLVEPELETAELRTQSAEELADCYGLLGGIYRRWALQSTSDEDRSRHLLESIRAYDESWKFESGSYGVTSSYGMLNRLVSRLLYRRKALTDDLKDVGPDGEPLDLRFELERAGEHIGDEVKKGRTDYWADADAALIDLLLENEKSPASAYAAFLSKSPPASAFTSVLDVLRPLAALELPVKPVLQDAVTLLEKRAPGRRACGRRTDVADGGPGARAASWRA